IHIDHRLQEAAVEFRRCCEALCLHLDVPLDIVEIDVARLSGRSIEEMARGARYQAIGRRLAAGECLLTAHHARDQAETVLLQLLRGAGLKGLAAMPPCRPWHAGWHLRPMLRVAAADLQAFAAEAGIDAVADPMNRDCRFDRSYLRLHVWPLLEQRWPGVEKALARAARHVADGQALLDHAAAQTLAKIIDGAALSVRGLRTLSAAEQINVLRHWIDRHDIAMPPTARLHETLRQCMAAPADQLPSIVWGGHALRRYQDRLFLTDEQLPQIGETRSWDYRRCESLPLGERLGVLHWGPQAGGLDARRMPELLTVRQRRGGERLQPGRGGRTQTLQHLCQTAGIVPWMRGALPLIFAGEVLVAVGDLWQDARWRVAAGSQGSAVRWSAAPPCT
ncbi:MAG: tRNA lysidine(34) synthetase TilS, partial [Pseudomonadota bacterium]|nr:tRNA lysidine(34) synthetase TilS [Pseudomonadota bacterium]